MIVVRPLGHDLVKKQYEYISQSSEDTESTFKVVDDIYSEFVNLHTQHQPLHDNV